MTVCEPPRPSEKYTSHGADGVGLGDGVGAGAIEAVRVSVPVGDGTGEGVLAFEKLEPYRAVKIKTALVMAAIRTFPFRDITEPPQVTIGTTRDVQVAPASMLKYAVEKETATSCWPSLEEQMEYTVD